MAETELQLLKRHLKYEVTDSADDVPLAGFLAASKAYVKGLIGTTAYELPANADLVWIAVASLAGAWNEQREAATAVEVKVPWTWLAIIEHMRGSPF